MPNLATSDKPPHCICLNARWEIPAVPTPHLRHSNDLPSFEEQRKLKAYLHDIQTRLTQANRDAEYLRQLLVRQDRYRQSLEDTWQDYNQVAARTRVLLPQEILSQIFVYWHDSATNGEDERTPPDEVPDTFDPIGGPMLLTHICRWWRLAALATHELWTTIRVRVDFHESDEQTQLELVKTWIKRAGDVRPFTIYVEVGADTRLARRNQLLRAIGTVSSRWKHIFFRFVHSSGYSTLRYLTQCAAPQLQLFSLSDNGNGYPDEVVPSSASDVFNLSISHPTQHAQAFVLDIPLSISALQFSTRTLREIYLYPHQSVKASIGDCLSILMHALNLEIFYARCDMNGPSPIPLASPITTPSLRHIHLIIGEGEVHPHPQAPNVSIFDLFVAPQLRRVELDANLTLPLPIFQSLDTFLSRPEHENISNLSIDAPFIRWRRLYPSLSRLRRLERLTFSSAQRWSDTDFEPFLTDFLPSIEVLCIQSKLRVTADGFSRFFADRWFPADSRPVVPLRGLFIDGTGDSHHFIDEAVHLQLSQGVGTGKEVEIRLRGVPVFP